MPGPIRNSGQCPATRSIRLSQNGRPSLRKFFVATASHLIEEEDGSKRAPDARAHSPSGYGRIFPTPEIHVSFATLTSPTTAMTTIPAPPASTRL